MSLFGRPPGGWPSNRSVSPELGRDASQNTLGGTPASAQSSGFGSINRNNSSVGRGFPPRGTQVAASTPPAFTVSGSRSAAQDSHAPATAFTSFVGASSPAPTPAVSGSVATEFSVPTSPFDTTASSAPRAHSPRPPFTASPFARPTHAFAYNPFAQRSDATELKLGKPTPTSGAMSNAEDLSVVGAGHISRDEQPRATSQVSKTSNRGMNEQRVPEIDELRRKHEFPNEVAAKEADSSPSDNYTFRQPGSDKAAADLKGNASGGDIRYAALARDVLQLKELIIAKHDPRLRSMAQDIRELKSLLAANHKADAHSTNQDIRELGDPVSTINTQTQPLAAIARDVHSMASVIRSVYDSVYEDSMMTILKEVFEALKGLISSIIHLNTTNKALADRATAVGESKVLKPSLNNPDQARFGLSVPGLDLGTLNRLRAKSQSPSRAQIAAAQKFADMPKSEEEIVNFIHALNILGSMQDQPTERNPVPQPGDSESRLGRGSQAREESSASLVGNSKFATAPQAPTGLFGGAPNRMFTARPPPSVDFVTPFIGLPAPAIGGPFRSSAAPSSAAGAGPVFGGLSGQGAASNGPSDVPSATFSPVGDHSESNGTQPTPATSNSLGNTAGSNRTHPAPPSGSGLFANSNRASGPDGTQPIPATSGFLDYRAGSNATQPAPAPGGHSNIPGINNQRPPSSAPPDNVSLRRKNTAPSSSSSEDTVRMDYMGRYMRAWEKAYKEWDEHLHGDEGLAISMDEV